MTPKEVVAAATITQSICVSITGKSANEDLLRRRGVITPILLQLPYHLVQNADNPWGVITPSMSYDKR